MIDLDKLETLARAATPGPWECDSLFNVRHGSTGIVYRAIDTIGRIPIDKDAAFIAAANPAVVLELIAELRREREKYKHATIRYHEECNVRDWLAMHFGKLEKCKTCKELPDDIVTVQDCIQCVVEYARENMGGKDD